MGAGGVRPVVPQTEAPQAILDAPVTFGGAPVSFLGAPFSKEGADFSLGGTGLSPGIAVQPSGNQGIARTWAVL